MMETVFGMTGNSFERVLSLLTAKPLVIMVLVVDDKRSARELHVGRKQILRVECDMTLSILAIPCKV